MKELIRLVLIDYQGHVFSILALLLWVIIKADKRHVKQTALCEGKFNVVGTELTGIKKDVKEVKTEVKEVKAEVEKLEDEQTKIKISIAEKFASKKEA